MKIEITAEIFFKHPPSYQKKKEKKENLFRSLCLASFSNFGPFLWVNTLPEIFFSLMDRILDTKIRKVGLEQE